MSLVESENQDSEEIEEPTDRPELQECRETNKGKWCTCRKLLKFVEKKIGKVLGIYIPQVSCGAWRHMPSHRMPFTLPSAEALGNSDSSVLNLFSVRPFQAEAVPTEAMQRCEMLVRKSEKWTYGEGQHA